MTQPLQDRDPRRIGPYAVLARIGAGGMGQVYLGQAPEGTRCAVKVIHPGLAHDAAFRTRFTREVALARKVDGPHLGKVLAADLDGPLPWLATEYVPGRSLDQAVQADGPLPESDVRGMAAELFAALAAVHAAGVIHRDIKPANILLGPGGATLIDFGIAHTADSTRITHTGMVVGSPAFMAPEQAVGEQVGPPADVFALAAVLVHASTGVGPYGTGSPAALLLRAADAPVRLDDVPPNLRPMLELCLAKDPAARPTAAMLAATLASGAPTRTVPARPPRVPAPATATEPSSRRASRPLWLVAAVIVVVVATTATVLVIRANTGRAPTTPSVPGPVEITAKTTSLTFTGIVHDVAFDADGRRGFVAHDGGLDVIDTATKTVRTQVALTKPSVVAISPDGSRVYAGLRNGYLQVLDASTFRSLTSIDTGVSPMSMVISRDGRKLFLASSGGDADAVLATVDVTTGQVSNTVLSGVKGTIELVMSADGDRLFVEATDAVIEIDPPDGSIKSRMPMDFAEIAPVSGDRMLAVIRDYDRILPSLLDGNGTATALPAPRRAARSENLATVEDLEGISDGSRAYLLREATSAAGGSRLDVLDPATGNTTTQLFVPGPQLSAEELRMSPDGGLAVVIPFNDKSIILVDIPTP